MKIQVSLRLSAYSYTTFSHFGIAVSFSYLHHKASTSFNKTDCQRSGRGGLGDPDAQNYFIGHSRFGFNRLIADLAL